jgi:hypothetical protein
MATLPPSPRRSPGPARRYLSSRSRLTRAHSQLVSRLHATFRAMELSPDLARRGISPINDSLIEASRSVLVSHQPAAAAPSSPAASEPGGLPSDFAERARSDLRSMSQRLERLLRERREAVERARFRLRMRHQQHEEEEEELESEGVLPPPAGLPGLGPAAEEGFHVTLGRNRSDIERWVFLFFFGGCGSALI